MSTELVPRSVAEDEVQAWLDEARATECRSIEGVWHDLPMWLYLSIPAASSSGLNKLLDRTPAHLRAHLDKPPPTTDAQHFGTAVHVAALEPELFEHEFVLEPDLTEPDLAEYINPRATKLYKERMAEIQAEHPHAGVLTKDEWDQCMKIRDNIEKHPIFGPMVRDGGQVETTRIMVDPATGMAVKTRPDFAPTDWPGFVDLKTTARSATPWTWAKTVGKFGYHRQGALYLHVNDVLRARGLVEGPERHRWLFMVVEKSAPFAVRDIELESNALDTGKREVLAGLEMWLECLETGAWPAYPIGATCSLPNYHDAKA